MTGILLLCDHASNAVPVGIELGIDPRLLDLHIAVDIGAGPLTEALAATLDAPAVIGRVSRLVIDLNRAPEQAGLVPLTSDGHAIPGNAAADIPDRLARFHAPYHAAIHSFTPALEQGGPPRPWEIGILSNQDRRAADPALALFARAGVIVGDNEPYSGRTLNATLDRHGEGRGITSLSIEVRNDLIDTDEGVARWATIVAPILSAVCKSLAFATPPAT